MRPAEPAPRESAAGASERGVTVVELMVAITLTTIVVGAVLSVMISQSRFLDRLGAGATQLEQVRAASDLINTEVADLVRGAVVAARRDSVTIRLPISWGVLCGEEIRQTKVKGKTKKKAVELEPNSAVYVEPIPEALGSPTPEGFAVSSDGTSWTFHDVSWPDAGVHATTEARTSCLGDANANGAETNLYARFENLKDYVPAVPNEGMVVFLYVYVSHLFRAASGVDGLVLFRGGRSGVAQRLAWPFAPSAGFRYRLDDGTEREEVTGADLVRIRAIQMRLPARREAGPTWGTDSLDVVPWASLYNAR